MDLNKRPAFGALLKGHRVAAGLTQEQLAERAGLSAQAVGALERGIRQAPYRDTVQALADALALAPMDADALAASVSRHRAGALTPRDGISLPAPTTPIVGREVELAEVLALLDRADVRLVTLTGPGGVGKTRLALEVGRAAADDHAAGAAFVGLAPLQDPDLVAAAIARALGLRERAGHSFPDALRAFLRDRDLLLLLDNFEHVAVIAPLVADLLAACRGLRVLVTSRARLRVGGEHVYPVRPLPTPDPRNLPPLAGLAAAPAVALLVQRARSVAPDFELGVANAMAVAAICDHLDGLPLALELAAARLTVLSPELLLRRLTPRLPLLADGARDRPERQQTLRATLDWSHALLGPADQAVFRRVSAFAGGCTLEAAEAVCAGCGGVPPGDIVERLGVLLDQSLLRREDAVSGEPRFAMLETIREYAAERLAESGETDAAHLAHAAYFGQLVEVAEPELGGPEQIAWLARLEREHDNLRVALGWTLQSAGAETALRLATALWRFWLSRGAPSEGRRWLEAALAMPAAQEPSAAALRARALTGNALLAVEQGEWEAARHYSSDAVALARGSGAPRELVGALNAHGLVARQGGDYPLASACHEEALALADPLGDRAGVAASFTGLAYAALFTGDTTRAGELLGRALAGYRALGDLRGSAEVLVALAGQALHTGRYDRVIALAEEALALYRALGDAGRTAEALWMLGVAAQFEGHYERSTECLEESLTLRRARGEEGGLPQTLGALGHVTLLRGDLARARVLMEESLAVARRLPSLWGEAMGLVQLGHVTMAEGDSDGAAALFREGGALLQAIGNPVYLPWCLEGLAGVAAAGGRRADAARLCGARDALRAQLGLMMPPANPAAYGRTVATVRAALGAATFDAVRLEGERVPAAQLIAAAANW